jgi:hypothetical protein
VSNGGFSRPRGAIAALAKHYRPALCLGGATSSLVLAIVLCVGVLFGAPTTALAQCTGPSGGVETCTGNLPGPQNFNTSAGINDLEVNNVTTGPSQISLTGTGAGVGNGASANGTFGCQITNTGNNPSGASCTINNAANPPTCSATNGDNQTATCIAATSANAQTGPAGQQGPPVTVNVVAPTSGPVTIGGLTPVAVQGISTGSTGGNGGDAHVAGNGGDGGAGVDGGKVIVNFTGVIPAGNGSYGGILAQTVGGNGGNGGSAGFLGGSGGNGGAGGFGGNATASFLGGSITVAGKGNVGVSAISEGGNGGSGASGGFFVSGGGNGNSAGQAGTAAVVTSVGTTISTCGDYGHGIAAYSLGGAGGSGAGGFGLFYSGGGSGNTGGNGGTANVIADGTITTTGQYANGILAQSIGGGGSAGSVSGAVSLGRSRAGGGGGGTVTVTNSGAVTTQGFGSNAIEAQSIGGGGGNGANSGALFNLGAGNGATTSAGGMVSVTNEDHLVTYSSQATGILAQSIGGGGGNGGTTAGVFNFGSGGGGGGGAGGNVTVTNGGNIDTGTNGATSYTGNFGAGISASPGILAQSIGGGGGNGGGSVSVAPFAAVAFGGQGGAGGAGGTVQVLRDNANSALASAYNINTTATRPRPSLRSRLAAAAGMAVSRSPLRAVPCSAPLSASRVQAEMVAPEAPSRLTPRAI